MPSGTVHAVDEETGEVACGFGSDALSVFPDVDFEAASFLEKCPDCRQALARG